MKKYPAVKKKVGGSPKKALRYFVRYGMKKQHQAIKTFNVRSYRYGNPSLRKKYRLNYKKYYLYYIKAGYKKPSAKRTRTGVKKMVSPAVVYGGIDYSALYDYFYYTKHKSTQKIRKQRHKTRGTSDGGAPGANYKHHKL